MDGRKGGAGGEEGGGGVKEGLREGRRVFFFSARQT